MESNVWVSLVGAVGGGEGGVLDSVGEGDGGGGGRGAQVLVGVWLVEGKLGVGTFGG